MKKAVLAIAVGVVAVGYQGQAAAEDRLFTPSLSVSEEYTDNVFDTKANKRTDYITRLRPGFTTKYQASRWNWDAAYNLDYRYYARDSKTNDLAHDASLKGSIVLLENFFFLDLGDTYKRVSLNTMRDDTVASAFANQSDQNIATINPYLLWRPGKKTNLKTGYRYLDTRYWDTTGIDKKSHSGYGDLTYELTSKLNLLANYTFTHQESSDQIRYNRHDASGGFKYSYAEKSYLYANGGYTWQFFSDNHAARYLFWNAGVVHDFNLFVATLETKRQTTEDPRAESTRETSYLARLDRTFERGAVGVSGGYTEYSNTYANAITGTTAGDRNKTAVGATGRYEVVDGLTANVGITGEHYHYSTIVTTSDNYPYRLTGTAGLAWQMMKDLTLSLNYSRISNQYKFDSLAGGWLTNRATLELKMVF
jgi:hypothetical protein